MDFYEQADTPRQTMPQTGKLTEDRVRLLINESLSRHEQRVLQHIDRQFNTVHDTLKSAFPNGDPHGHRLAHEKYMQDKAAWDKFKAELISKVATAGFISALMWMLLVVWQAIKESIYK